MPSGRLIAVASGKGGVGKTWLSITLAHALAGLNRRTLLFDGDLGLANVDIQLGLTPPFDLGAILSGKIRPEQAVVDHAAGFGIIAGRSGSGSLAGLDGPALESVLAAIRGIAARYDLTLLDLGAGLEPPVRFLAAAAAMLLAVATDEPTSLTDAYAVLKLHTHDRPGGDARIIVNQAATPASGQRTYATLRRVALCFLGQSPELAGIIRRDPHVPEAIRHQSLLLTRHPSSPAATDVHGIARTLL